MRRDPNPRGTGDQLRADLVAAASALLVEPHAVALPSLRAVARACSVSPAAVYLHFDSVQSLTAAVLDAQLDDLESSMRPHLADGVPARDQLADFGAAYVRWGIEHPGAYQLIFESADRLDLPDREHVRWSLIDEVARLVSESTGASTPDASVTAVRLWTILHGMVSLRIHKPSLPWGPIAVELDDVLARYLQPS